MRSIFYQDLSFPVSLSRSSLSLFPPLFHVFIRRTIMLCGFLMLCGLADQLQTFFQIDQWMRLSLTLSSISAANLSTSHAYLHKAKHYDRLKPSDPTCKVPPSPTICAENATVKVPFRTYTSATHPRPPPLPINFTPCLTVRPHRAPPS